MYLPKTYTQKDLEAILANLRNELNEKQLMLVVNNGLTRSYCKE